MAGARGIDQRPEFLAAKDFGDSAGEGDRYVAEQAAGNRTHLRDANPAQLLIGRGRQLPTSGLVKIR